MKQFAIFLLSIILFSCNEKKPQHANADISDSTRKETYIERYIREEIVERWEKEHPRLPKDTAYVVHDSILIDKLNCVLYNIRHEVTDGGNYYVLREKETNIFYPFSFVDYTSMANLSIDDAYKIWNYKNHKNEYVFIEPYSFELKGLEVFLNQYVSRKHNLKTDEIDLIFEDFLQLKKIQTSNEIDSLITQTENNYMFHGYKSKFKAELQKSLIDGLKYPDKLAMYAIREGILCVNIFPMGHYYSIRIFRIQ